MVRKPVTTCIHSQQIDGKNAGEQYKTTLLAANVAWASPECMAELSDRSCFPRCPEICVEVLSPGNTEAELHEKMELSFNAGAKEVWICETFGAMRFLGPELSRCPSPSFAQIFLSK